MVFDNERKNELISSCDLETELDERQLCDVELLMQGGILTYFNYVKSFNLILHCRLFAA